MPPRPRSILLASGQRLFPAGWGGGELTAHDFLTGLAREGWRVRAIGACQPSERGVLSDRLAGFFEGRPGPVDDGPDVLYDAGYPVRIAPEAEFVGRVREAIARERPDLLFVQALGWPDAAAEAHAAGVPVVLYVLADEVLRIRVPGRAPDLVLFDSDAHRRSLAGAFPFGGEVFYPPVDLDRVRTEGGGPPGALLLANPLPVKGLDVFLALAEAFPARRFLAVEGWLLPPFVAKRLARHENVEVWPWQHDMRRAYRETAIALVPSAFEPFGRLPVEAGCCGVPSITSGVGGLPESAGDGARHVGLDEGIGPWIRAVEDWSDPARHAEASARARAWAARLDVPRARERVRARVEPLLP